MSFVAAKNKLEVVARISALTNSGPEALGPGSKERKSVVENLAKGLKVSIEDRDTKQDIARKIALKLGVSWNHDCESTGQTLTLKGLNLLLESSTEYFTSNSILEHRKFKSIEDEIDQISKILKITTPKKMEGKKAVIEMKDAEFTKWRETEWQGFYFEFKVLPELINKIGGGPKRIERTIFDYVLQTTWDLKVHSISENGNSRNGCQLNDARSIDKAVIESGFGLIVLNGIPILDQDFSIWHKQFRGGGDGVPRRKLKKEFKSLSIDFFYIPDSDRLEKAKSDNEIKYFRQGRQQSGASRNQKYSLDLSKAIRSDLLVHEIRIN